MGLTIIFNWKGSGLKSRRSDKEKELQKEGWGSSLTEEEIDKCAHIERKAHDQSGSPNVFVQHQAIDKIK